MLMAYDAYGVIIDCGRDQMELTNVALSSHALDYTEFFRNSKFFMVRDIQRYPKVVHGNTRPPSVLSIATINHPVYYPWQHSTILSYSPWLHWTALSNVHGNPGPPCLLTMATMNHPVYCPWQHWIILSIVHGNMG